MALNGLSDALVFVILAGVIMDVFSFSALGTNTASFVAISLIVSFFAKRLSVSQPFWKFFILIFLVGTGSYLNDFIVNILRVLSGNTSGMTGIFFSTSLYVNSFVNMSMAILLYWPLKKVMKAGVFSYENRNNIIR